MKSEGKPRPAAVRSDGKTTSKSDRRGRETRENSGSQVQPVALLACVLGAAGALTVAGIAVARRLRRDQSDPVAAGTAGRRFDEGPVRSAGPGGMRTNPARDWSVVDQASDESFPASDPPATY